MSVHLLQPSKPALVWPPATQAERDRVRDAAIVEAHALRRAAVSEFWRSADAWVADAAREL